MSQSPNLLIYDPYLPDTLIGTLEVRVLKTLDAICILLYNCFGINSSFFLYCASDELIESIHNQSSRHQRQGGHGFELSKEVVLALRLVAMLIVGQKRFLITPFRSTPLIWRGIGFTHPVRMMMEEGKRLWQQRRDDSFVEKAKFSSKFSLCSLNFHWLINIS